MVSRPEPQPPERTKTVFPVDLVVFVAVLLLLGYAVWSRPVADCDATTGGSRAFEVARLAGAIGLGGAVVLALALPRSTGARVLSVVDYLFAGGALVFILLVDAMADGLC
jgi:hypothetical protein